MTLFIQITTTTASHDEARRIARILIEQHLAACAQVSGPVTSVYHWQDKIEEGTEWCCTVKTRESLFEKVAAAIYTVHSYHCPEIVSTPIVGASDDYLAWLDRELAE